MKRTMVCLGIAAALVWTSHAPLPAQDVRLPMRLEDVFSPVFLFVPASNGGSLIAEPGGAVRFLYRTGPGHEGSGGFVYEDTSHDGGESWSLERLSFDPDFSVQVFEIVIRTLGGLISAYQMDGDDRFLDLAVDLADRLLPAFE